MSDFNSNNGRRKSVPTLIATEAVVRRLSEVEPENLEWLWPGRIPLGKLTLLAGDPGLGKSFLTCDMAARVSVGAVWPDDPSQQQSVGSVVMFNCEDGLSDTIRPRLDAAGADVSKIVAIEGVKLQDAETGETRQRSFTLAGDLPVLAREVEKLSDCRLIVIDPVSAYLGAETDSHKNSDMRALLAPLADLAHKHRAAVVMVTHLAKGGGTKAVYRPMGSLAFAAAARAVWFVGKAPNDEQRRLVLPAKMNLAPNPTGLAYCIELSRIVWEPDPITLPADDLLAHEAIPKAGDAGSSLSQATEWLEDALSNGPRLSRQIITDGKENEFGEKLIRRAFNAMGGKPRKDGMEGPWIWSLPGWRPQPESESSQSLKSPAPSSLFSPIAVEDVPKLPKLPPF